MVEISVYDARNRLSALLDQVERGEEVVITRRGKPIAKLVDARGDDRAVAAARDLLRLRETLRRGGQAFTHDELRAMREDGRR